jgi:hypothetical protein
MFYFACSVVEVAVYEWCGGLMSLSVSSGGMGAVKTPLCWYSQRWLLGCCQKILCQICVLRYVHSAAAVALL